MPYAIRRHESTKQAVRRIAVEQLDEAIIALGDRGRNPHRIVHDVRRGTKRLRALLLLIRPHPGEKSFGGEQRRLRDAARRLSGLRDAQIRIATFDGLVSRGDVDLPRPSVARMRELLVRQRDREVEASRLTTERLTEVAGRLREIRDRAAHWRIRGKGFDALAEGLDDVYRQGRRVMRIAYRDDRTEAFHAWRRWAKYHWHHIHLLEGIWTPILRARGEEAHRISDLLGDEHDLWVLRGHLREHRADLGPRPETKRVIAGIDARRRELRERAEPIGRRLYAEKPRAFLAGWSRWWDAWHAHAGAGAPALVARPPGAAIGRTTGRASMPGRPIGDP